MDKVVPAKNRPDYRNHAIMRIKEWQIKEHKYWSKASFDAKKKIVGDFLAPFIYNEVELSEVLAEIDNR